jgi:hypothetical protein
MNKVLKSVVCLLFVLVLTGCSLFGGKPKEFSGGGMTVTLTDDFVLGENIQVNLYITSNKYMFVGLGESKSLLSSNGYYNIDTEMYARLVLANNSKNAKVLSYEDEDTSFNYAYYESTVSGVSYSYMMVCMEGKSKFYTMNFACFTKNYNDKTKDLFMKWAKTIRVE